MLKALLLSGLFSAPLGAQGGPPTRPAASLGTLLAPLLHQPTSQDYSFRQQLILTKNTLKIGDRSRQPFKPFSFLVPASDLQLFYAPELTELEANLIQRFKRRIDGEEFILFPIHPKDHELLLLLNEKYALVRDQFDCFNLSNQRTFFCYDSIDVTAPGFFLKTSDPEDLVYHHADLNYVRGSVLANDLMAQTDISVLPEFFGAAFKSKKFRKQGFLLRSAQPTHSLGAEWTQPLPLHVFLGWPDFLNAWGAHLGINKLEALCRLFYHLGHWVGHQHVDFGLGIVPHFQNVWMQVNARTGEFAFVYQDMGDVIVDTWYRFLSGRSDVIKNNPNASAEVLAIAYDSELQGVGDPIGNISNQVQGSVSSFEYRFYVSTETSFGEYYVPDLSRSYWNGYVDAAMSSEVMRQLPASSRPSGPIDLVMHDYPGSRYVFSPGRHNVLSASNFDSRVLDFQRLAHMARQMINELYYPSMNRAQIRRYRNHPLGSVERPPDDLILKGRLQKFVQVNRQELLDRYQYVWRREGDIYFAWYQSSWDYPFPVAVLAADKKVDFRGSILKLIEACGRERMGFATKG